MMYNLIKFEVYKLKNSRILKIFSLIILVIIIYVFKLFICNNGRFDMFESIYNGKDFGFFVNRFTDILHPTAVEFFYSAFGYTPILIILSVFLVANFVVNEYTDGTIKNIISYGHNRVKVYISKLIIISCTIILLTLMELYLPVLISYVFRWTKNISFIEIEEMIKVTFLVCLIFICMASIYMCISTIIKNKSIVVGLGIVCFFLNAAGFFLHFKFDKYTPTFMLMSIGSSNLELESIYYMIISCGILIIISTSIGIFAFKKQDIK